ncbi:MAG: rubredoxin [Clostridiales bacterium]|nr:rubredoxin [Clostridiales bacterium]
MKYVCKICGYVYDDEKQAVPFAELPDSWVCPLCKAAKSDFKPQEEPQQTAKPRQAVQLDEDMYKLSAGELSVVCSNLARGCEKQYRQEEAKLFGQLADYFAGITPEAEKADMEALSELLQKDVGDGYENVRSAAEDKKDRGAMRVCVWGEKVSLIMKGLLQRYQKEGEAFLANTEIWVCTTCGFVYAGDNPPKLCPVCKVPDWKFEKVEGRGFS